MAPIVVALGGNALIRPGEQGTYQEQSIRVADVMKHLAPFVSGGLVVTHGNGPQVGRHLRRSDLTQDVLPPAPLDLAVAATQAEIGVMIQQALGNSLADHGHVATVVTQVLVDQNDPAFLEPTKYVGAFFTQEQAQSRAVQFGWQVKADGDRGWRRVVPSPQPQEILELSIIRDLVGLGRVVVCCGGGGVPVIRTKDGQVSGVAAVIDKDHATALLAEKLQSRRLVILTGVDKVWVDFGTDRARPLDRISVTEAETLADAGQFPAGSMGPKMRAAIRFARTGGEVLITSPEKLGLAMQGKTGTLLQPG